MLSHGPKGKVTIDCVVGDAEGQTFANDVLEVLKSSGWPVEGVDQGIYSGGANPVGFGILVHRAATAPQYAGVLQSAFFSVGLAMGGAESDTVPEGTVQIIVGNKPNVSSATQSKN